MNKSKFSFPVGYQYFHKDQLFNFQLNRWYSFGYAKFEDMQEAGRKIENFPDWKREFIRLAEKAATENRLINAAFYYRAAEFYTFAEDPDKELLYDKFSNLFSKAFKNDNIKRYKVAYGKKFLPAMEVSAGTAKAKGTIVMFGGFDSYIEEFYSWMRYFADHGYKVIAFEGPGQGAARKKYGLALDYKWERPTKAVLDYFNLDNVILLGISMGGWFCFRAAAFEPRIKKVIASGVAFDYMQMPPLPLQWLTRFLLQFEGLMNYLGDMKMKKDPTHNWSVHNAMYVTKTKTPMASMKTFLQLNENNLHSELVKQDVLILSGAEDHFIPLKMHYKQIEALTNAGSVTGRIFTEKEQAQNHCQVGNTRLALETMLNWIAQKSPSN